MRAPTWSFVSASLSILQNASEAPGVGVAGPEESAAASARHARHKRRREARVTRGVSSSFTAPPVRFHSRALPSLPSGMESFGHFQKIYTEDEVPQVGPEIEEGGCCSMHVAQSLTNAQSWVLCAAVRAENEMKSFAPPFRHQHYGGVLITSPITSHRLR
jgi:hypothetical protein